ncbi:MAG: hypothetical protein HYS21_13200 [Deltaproteobacteria bacterium]|nr:hypothetical protein [Deltaproteobacteria bacterium]
MKIIIYAMIAVITLFINNADAITVSELLNNGGQFESYKDLDENTIEVKGVMGNESYFFTFTGENAEKVRTIMFESVITSLASLYADNQTGVMKTVKQNFDAQFIPGVMDCYQKHYRDEQQVLQCIYKVTNILDMKVTPGCGLIYSSSKRGRTKAKTMNQQEALNFIRVLNQEFKNDKNMTDFLVPITKEITQGCK